MDVHRCVSLLVYTNTAACARIQTSFANTNINFFLCIFLFTFISSFFLQIMCCRLVSELLSPSLSSSSSSANLKFLIYLLILLTGVQSIDAFCDEHQWWQEQLNECIPCTVCDSSKSIVLRPCQKHSDTVCGTLDDVELELDWIKAAAVSAHQKQVCSTTISSFSYFFLFPVCCY